MSITQKPKQLFMYCCAHGYIEPAKQVFELKQKPPHAAFRLSRIEYDILFHIVCRDKHSEVAHWLYTICPTIDCTSVQLLVVNVCEQNSLSVVESCWSWLEQTCSNESQLNRAKNNALICACKHGHLHIAQWIRKHHFLDHPTINAAFVVACEEGQMKCARWLLTFNANLHDAFVGACKHNQFQIVEWLLTTCQRDWQKWHKKNRHSAHRRCQPSQCIDITSVSTALRETSQRGWVKMTKWLLHEIVQWKQTPRFSKGDYISKIVQNDVVHAFWRACESGHLDIALHVFGHLYACSNKESASLSALLTSTLCEQVCRNGHLHVLKWIHSMQKNNAPFNCPNKVLQMFGSACDGNLSVVRWLYATMQPSLLVESNEPSLYDSQLRFGLLGACEYGRLDIVKWLLCTVSYTSENKDDAFCAACEEGQLEVAQWLWSTFHMDVSLDYAYAFKHACRHGRLDVVKWLHSLNPSEHRFKLVWTFDLLDKDEDDDKDADEHKDEDECMWLSTQFGLNPDNAFIIESLDTER